MLVYEPLEDDPPTSYFLIGQVIKSENLSKCKVIHEVGELIEGVEEVERVGQLEE